MQESDWDVPESYPKEVETPFSKWLGNPLPFEDKTVVGGLGLLDFVSIYSILGDDNADNRIDVESGSDSTGNVL